MLRKNLVRSILSLIILVLAVAPVVAKSAIRLPAVLGDNMVLQRDVPAPIWGWAKPGESITVEFAGQTLKTDAGADGRWQVTLAALKPGKPASLTVTGAKSGQRVLKDVLVGEVWICSGQSNMDMPLRSVNRAKAEIAAANYPRIRLMQLKRAVADKPQSDCQGKWVKCSPAVIRNYTAVGYFFGRELVKELDVPVGLIQTSWGGTPAEAWTGRAALEAKPELAPLLARWDRQAAANPKMAKDPHRPANIYNAMIAPLVPMAVRGAIWYQGEGNVDRAYQYRTLFPTMIENWRSVWNQPAMPFGFVQIAPFRYAGRGKNQELDPRRCAELWEAQLLTLKHVPATGMVVTTDIANLNNIHPKNKQAVGHRMALWALATVYGQKDLVYSGPIYQSMTVEGDAIRLAMDHVGGGVKSSDGKPLCEFTIAGSDQVFHPAVATIDGSTVVVRSDAVKQPVAVRFAWHEAAQPNLANKEGLPASPFRTDTWKGVTEGVN